MNKLTAEVARRDIGHLKSYPSRSLREELYLQALQIALPVLEQGDGWISCSERMPEVYVAVNFWVMGSVENDICESAYNGYWDGEVWHQDATLTGYDNSPMVRSCVEVTHWVPLPAPPQPQTDTYRQIENDGWIEWGGGKCPVKDGAIVDVRLRSGQAKFFCASEALIWTNGNSVRDEMDCDIIAYRVIEMMGGKDERRAGKYYLRRDFFY